MELVRRIAERWAREPGRVVLVEHLEDRSTTWTAAAFRRLVEHQKLRLTARDVSRLGLCGSNSAGLAASFLAALELGVAVVPFSAGLPMDEVFERARHFGVDLVWHDGGAATPHPIPFESISGATEHAADAPSSPPREAHPTAPALLLSTSGTTGEPRAVVVSRASLSSHTLGLVDEVLALSDADRVLLALPLAHSYGCRMGLLAPLATGAVVHLVARFSARVTLRVLVDERLTWAPVVPTMLAAWVALPGVVPPAMRWVLSAGAPLPEGLRARAAARLGCDVHEGYGLTEASFSTLDRPGSHLGGRPGEVPVHGAVGRPTPGVEVRIEATTGEVQVRGANVMSGYLDDPDGTARVISADGWLRTGDLGRWQDGRLVIVDRIKDIILCGGHTVYPAEVERALSHADGVVGCAVFGLPDAFLGERVAAAIVWSAADVALPEEERRTRLNDIATHHVASYAVPTSWFFVDRLPTGASGKVVKRTLRQRFSGGTVASEASETVDGLVPSE